MLEIILDQCLEEIRAGRASIAECLAQYPDFAAELKPLLEVAAVLQSAPDVQPSAEFKREVRDLLLKLPPPPAPSSEGGSSSPPDEKKESNDPPDSRQSDFVFIPANRK